MLKFTSEIFYDKKKVRDRLTQLNNNLPKGSKKRYLAFAFELYPIIELEVK